MPTVLRNVTDKMPAYDEELFGPVAAVISAVDEKDAVRIANDTIFGLGAAIFTQDIENINEMMYIIQVEGGQANGKNPDGRGHPTAVRRPYIQNDTHAPRRGGGSRKPYFGGAGAACHGGTGLQQRTAGIGRRREK
jgi:hypothetical protein